MKTLKLGVVLTFIMLSLTSFAQTMKVSGIVVDRDTKEGVYMATIQLLKADSTFVRGTLSGEDGSFSLELPAEGKFILKFSSVGYKNLSKNITASQSKPDINLGKITFGADAIMLKGATVLGQAA